VEKSGFRRLQPLLAFALAEMQLGEGIKMFGAVIIVQHLSAIWENLLDKIPNSLGAFTDETEPDHVGRDWVFISYFNKILDKILF
jgi:hypothetical protein